MPSPWNARPSAPASETGQHPRHNRSGFRDSLSPPLPSSSALVSPVRVVERRPKAHLGALQNLVPMVTRVGCGGRRNGSHVCVCTAHGCVTRTGKPDFKGRALELCTGQIRVKQQLLRHAGRRGCR